MEELYSKLNLMDNQWDRLMFYAVTGRRLEGDTSDYNSSDEDKETDIVIGSPQGSPLKAKTPKSAKNAVSTNKMDMNEF